MLVLLGANRTLHVSRIRVNYPVNVTAQVQHIKNKKYNTPFTTKCQTFTPMETILWNIAMQRI
jgi:hypothetical protein